MPTQATAPKKRTRKKRVTKADIKKAIRGTPNYTEDGRIEYVNHTKSVTLFVDVTDEFSGKIEPLKLNPGESVFFTPEDLIRNKRKCAVFFTDGLLRRVEAEDTVIDVIDVRDEMSIPEIEAFVERSDEIDPFSRDLKKLKSINTLSEVEKHCKELNKTWQFIEAVINRKEEVEESRKR